MAEGIPEWLRVWGPPQGPETLASKVLTNTISSFGVNFFDFLKSQNMFKDGILMESNCPYLDIKH